MSSPLGLLFVGIDAIEFREEEAKKRLTLKPAGLSNSEQSKIVLRAGRGKRSGDFPLDREVSNGSLGGVVVPRNAVMFQEREKRVFVAHKSLYIFRGDFLAGRKSVDGSAVEPLHPPGMLPQMECFQPKSLDAFENWDKKIPHGCHEPLEFFIKRILPKILVQVSDQMP